MAEIRFCDSCEGSIALGEPSMEQDGKLYCAPCWRALFGPAENPAEHKPIWVAPAPTRIERFIAAVRKPRPQSACSRAFSIGFGAVFGVLAAVILLVVLLFGGCAGCLSMVS